VGPEAEGVFTLIALLFFLIGVALFGIGLLGEYVGRIYAQVRERPRYIVEAVLEEGGESGEPVPVGVSSVQTGSVQTGAGRSQAVRQ
jgi:hypothetical protein